MAVEVDLPVAEYQLWPQGDARDPLGVWVARARATGDASGGVVEGEVIVPAARRRGRIYTCYSVSSTRESGPADTGTVMKVRLITGWPDADTSLNGIQPYETFRTVPITSETVGAPNHGPTLNALSPLDRFLLLFDFTASQTGNLVIVQLQRDVNTNTVVYLFQAYGYFWDRSILETPGGPRHPGTE